MGADCLEKLAAALNAHPDCDLAHCPPKYIDGQGQIIESQWGTKSMIGRTSGRLLEQCHLRKAPYDGLLHLAGESVYISITQLLIRKTLFDKIGLFKSDWGSIGDFEWNMRASLVASTIHVPNTWGGWRLHASQATASSGYGSQAHGVKIEQMIDSAVASVSNLLDQDFRAVLRSDWRNYFILRRELESVLQAKSSRIERGMGLIRQVLSGSRTAREYFLQRVSGHSYKATDPHDLICRWMKTLGIEQPLRPILK